MYVCERLDHVAVIVAVVVMRSLNDLPHLCLIVVVVVVLFDVMLIVGTTWYGLSS